MGRYIGRRLFSSLFVLFGVSLIVFSMLRLSGDPVRLMLPLHASDEDARVLARALGLDQPLPVQFARFLAGAVRGDFGVSLRQGVPAMSVVLERLPATIELTISSLLFTVVVAVPAGIYSATHRHSIRNSLFMLGALLGQSMPVFWLGIVLILVLAVELRWFPTSGRGGLEHLVLPTITLGAYFTAKVARLVRSGMLDVLSQDYVRTAYAKGLSNRIVISRHAMRNAAMPLVTIIAIDAGTLLGGAVITETVFAWPGVGRLAIQAISDRDYPVVQAAVFIVALGFVLINLLVDLVYGYLDPRIRYD
jgi:peptide/nickel transport system permease protein